MIYNSISELVGKTPLMELNNIEKELDLKANLFAKLELFNPTGSSKARASLNMLDTYEKEGKLLKGGTIIEPTSGNTGIGLAAIGASRGYRVIIVMPDSMSIERQKLMTAYGAELVLTPGSEGMQGSINKANELNKEIKGSIIAGQFTNEANSLSHYFTTAPEIYSDLDGKIDIFVAGVGTGGTITGCAKYLKEKKKNITIVAVEPSDSPLLSKGFAGPHKIQGIGANFVPKILDISLIDDVSTRSTEDSYAYSRLLAKKEGILCGISSGAALSTAIEYAKKDENTGKNIVVVLVDTGERYLSTDLY